MSRANGPPRSDNELAIWTIQAMAPKEIFPPLACTRTNALGCEVR